MADFNYQEQMSLVIVNNKEVEMTDNFIDLFSFRTKLEKSCQILSSLQWMNLAFTLVTAWVTNIIMGKIWRVRWRVYNHIFPQSLLTMSMRDAAVCILKTVYFWHKPKNVYHTLSLTKQVAHIKDKHTPLNIKASTRHQEGILSSVC